MAMNQTVALLTQRFIVAMVVDNLI